MMNKDNERLLVHSIFPSISGEVGAIPQGAPTVFLRLQGCNLCCPWCDTADSQEIRQNGLAPSIDKVERIIMGYPFRNVIITGGEPLLQSAPLQLLIQRLFYKGGRKIQVETNGTLPPSLLKGVYWVYDFKLHAPEKMIDLDEYAELSKGDWIKIVVASRDEFQAAIRIFAAISKRRQDMGLSDEDSPQFAVSAGNLSSNGMRLKPRALAGWLIESGRDNIILNTQLHKLLDLNESKHGTFFESP